VDGPSVSRWERAKVYPEQYLDALATALELDVSYFLSPDPDKTVTPDPFAKTEATQLDRIEAKLDEILSRLDAADIAEGLDDLGQVADQDAPATAPAARNKPKKRQAA
jgi:hypothetical protein